MQQANISGNISSYVYKVKKQDHSLYTMQSSNIFMYFIQFCGPGSIVSIATGYGLDGPGIESQLGGETFCTCPDQPWGPPSLLYNGYQVFPGGKERPGRDADPSPSSSAMVMKE